MIRAQLSTLSFQHLQQTSLGVFRTLERDANLLRPEGREYRFDHHQMREAIYEDLFEQLRDQFHLALGQAYATQWPEPDPSQAFTICHHLLRGGATERAEPYLLPALRKLRGSQEMERMNELATRALDAGVPRDPEARFEALRLACFALNQVGDAEREERYTDELLALAEQRDDTRARIDAFLCRANYLFVTSQLAPARDMSIQARDLARAEGLEDAEQQALRSIGMAENRLGNFEQALVEYRAALALAESRGDPAGQSSAHNGVYRSITPSVCKVGRWFRPSKASCR